jgi:outer membrane protein assembly factor BamB
MIASLSKKTSNRRSTDQWGNPSRAKLILASVLLFLTAIHCSPRLVGEDWSRFRGPDATGVVEDDSRLPKQWNATGNVAWSADIPGQGWGSPIVVGNRVFVSSVVADEPNIKPQKGLYLGKGVRDPAQGIHHWMVYCFDLTTGAKLWDHEAKTGRPVVPRHPKSSYAAETPVTDGERLFVLFGDVGLYCYSLQGDLLWSRDIEPKKTNMDYGAASSPVVSDGQVIVVYDNLESSWVASFDAKTGDEKWKTSRDETHSWATPLVWQNELRTEIVVPGRNKNRSYSLDGEVLWEFDGDMSVLVIPSPFASHGFCYIASGYVGDSHRPTFAIRPGASGDITPTGDYADSEFIEWYQPTSSAYNTSQIVYGDYLYTVYDQGFMTCHDAKTGKEVYGKRRFSPAGSFTASPWAYDGKVFCLSEDGLTYVIKAGKEFEILHTNPLEELCIATPSVADGCLLIRTLTKLYCITGNDKVTQAEPKSDPSADLLAACMKGDLQSARRSLKVGGNVNAKDPQGSSALHVATFFAYPKIVSLLLEKGADQNATNERGQRPLDIVQGEWNQELVRVYRFIGGMLEMEIDLERIKKNRPIVAEMLTTQ